MTKNYQDTQSVHSSLNPLYFPSEIKLLLLNSPFLSSPLDQSSQHVCIQYQGTHPKEVKRVVECPQPPASVPLSHTHSGSESVRDKKEGFRPLNHSLML